MLALYREAASYAPEIECHHYLPGALLPFAGIDRCRDLLQRAAALDPSFAHAHAALGNIAIREGRLDDALFAYSAAALADPHFAPAHLARASLLEALRRDAEAQAHYLQAWSLQRLYEAPRGAAVRRILVLKAPGTALANTPIEFAINTWRTALHVLYVDPQFPPPARLPEYDLVYGGMSEFESLRRPLAESVRLVASLDRPVLNHPKHLLKMRRTHLRKTLAAVEHCTVPQTVRAERSALHGELPFPALIRPVDSHRGDGLALVRGHHELQAYLEQTAEPAFFVSRFVDYRSPDGFYRKYRVTIVDGKPFPYHLAIAENWMVSYAGSLTRHHAWMRAEEERFLREPSSVFPAWNETFGAIARALGMEFVSVDCARAPDGTVLVFEAGPNMLVHCHDRDDALSYKYAYVPRIFDALERLFDERIISRKAPATRSIAGRR